MTIDLIDEAVDISKTAARDYIGSCRVPLREAYIKGKIEGTFPVIDENRGTNGDLVLTITVVDAPTLS